MGDPRWRSLWSAQSIIIVGCNGLHLTITSVTSIVVQMDMTYMHHKLLLLWLPNELPSWDFEKAFLEGTKKRLASPPPGIQVFYALFLSPSPQHDVTTYMKWETVSFSVYQLCSKVEPSHFCWFFFLRRRIFLSHKHETLALEDFAWLLTRRPS